MAQPSQTITGSDGWFYRLVEQATVAFDPQLFERSWLEQQSCPEVSATSQLVEGRARVCFFHHAGVSLVFKQYCRGGLPAKLTKDSYLWTGLHNTRAWRDFELLGTLQKLKLDAPRPYACAVQRVGLCYRAFLITEKIENAVSLAVKILQKSITESQWSSVGVAIAHFHQAGVYHADLNASNILIDADDKIFLIDFDRSEVRAVTRSATWPAANLDRLHRSLQKICDRANAVPGSADVAVFSEGQWGSLLAGYQSVIGDATTQP